MNVSKKHIDASTLFVLNFSRVDAKHFLIETEDGNAEAGGFENLDQYQHADPESWQPTGKEEAGGPGGLGWLGSVKG